MKTLAVRAFGVLIILIAIGLLIFGLGIPVEQVIVVMKEIALVATVVVFVIIGMLLAISGGEG